MPKIVIAEYPITDDGVLLTASTYRDLMAAINDVRSYQHINLTLTTERIDGLQVLTHGRKKYLAAVTDNDLQALADLMENAANRHLLLSPADLN